METTQALGARRAGAEKVADGAGQRGVQQEPREADPHSPADAPGSGRTDAAAAAAAAAAAG